MSKFLGRSFAVGWIGAVFAATVGILATTGNLAGQISSPPPPAWNSRDNDSVPPDPASPPLFRFVYVPEEAVSVLLPKPGIHFPMPADEFHRLWDKTREAGRRDRELDGRLVLHSLILSARLDDQQLVSGQGLLRVGSGDAAPSPNERQDSAGDPVQTDSPGATMSLSPFRLPVSHPTWSNGEPALLGLDASGETVLFLPPGASALTFDWTLRGETGTRNELVFSPEVPRFLRTELILDLPEDKKPIVPSGLVRLMEPPDLSFASDIPPGYRRWKIAVNGSQVLRLTVTPDEKSEKFFRSIGVFELHSYDLSLPGMQLKTRFFLEESDFVLNELTLELDKPLSLLSVTAGNRVLPWTEASPEEENATRFLVSVPYLESGIREIQVLAFCPVQTDRMWDLPRVHIRSPLFFWTETRNIVRVNRPLLTRKIDAVQHRQVYPSSGADETESDQFVFQAFSEASPLGLVLGRKHTRLNVESGTSIQWGDREIHARTLLELTVEEGEVQQLELDVAADWTVDLIESADPTRVANYFVEDAEQETGNEPSSPTRWIVPLRRAVDPSQPVRLIVQSRRPVTSDELLSSSDPAQNHRYPLSDFLPIRVPGGREGRPLIAFEPGRRYRVVAGDRRESSLPSPSREHIRERFDEIPLGTVFAVDESFQEDFLEIESLKPTCGMTAVTNLVFFNGTLAETCRFSCVPDENTPMGRLKIRFSQGSQADDAGDWTWTLERESETSRPLKAERLVSGDAMSVLPSETWELELPAPQRSSFDVVAARAVPFDSRRAIPLPFFPDIPEATAFVCIETRDTTPYRVSQNFLRPVSPPHETSAKIPTLPSHVVRGFYHYPADGDAFASENALLVLEPVSAPDPARDDSAGIWSLALHSHCLPNGNVTSYAVLALEKQTLDRLKIGMPPGVTADAIRNLWIDREKTSWTFVPENVPGGMGSGDLFVPLPPQRRYLTVTLEYVVPGGNPADSHRFRPAMPTFDVPVFTRTWYAWHPPQYRGFDVPTSDGTVESRTFGTARDQPAVGDFPVRLPFFDRDGAEFDFFSSRNTVFETIPASVKTDLAACSRRLASLLDDLARERRIRRPAAADGAPETPSSDSSLSGRGETGALTWGELFASGVMEDTVARGEGSQRPGRYFTVWIDGDSLAQAGLFPFSHVFPEVSAFADAETSPAVSGGGPVASRETGLELMERNRLAVIFDEHRNLLITSCLAAAKLRSQLVPVHADRFWFYPRGDIAVLVAGRNATEPGVFRTPSAWQNTAQENPFPFFSFGVPAYPGTDRPGWAVHEMVCEGECSPAILLIRHDALLARKLLVFFLIVLASWRIRPDRLAWVMLPPIVAVLLAGLYPPYIACLVPSVFWGMVCALAFGWVRRMPFHRRAVSRPVNGDQTTVVSPRDRDDDSEPGEVLRRVLPSRSPAERRDSRDFSTADIPATDIDPASKSVFLTLLVATICGLSFADAGTLSAQPVSQTASSPEFFPATMSPGQSLAGAASEPSDNASVRNRGTDFPPPYEVYVPYDSQGRIGDRYYLPDSLHRHLQGNDREATSPDRWRICKARYVGALAYNPVQNEVTLSHLRAIYDMELADASAVVRLPDMPVIPDEIRCDDRLIEPMIKPVSSGETGGNEYAMTLFGRGRHQLEISLQPTIYVASETSSHQFDFAIPPVPDSTLELTLPVSNLPVDVLHSFGRLSHTPDKWVASLGPVKRLSVSWPVSPPPQVNLEVSQYFHLSLAPFSVSPFSVVPEQTKLHAIFRFTVSGGSVKQIPLAVDPRYRLEEGSFRSTEIIESEPVIGAENLVHITFAQPVTKNVTIEAVFVPRSISGFGDFSGIGTLDLPRFSAIDARIVQSWLGVSSASSTEVELPPSNVETMMFENAWGFLDEPVHHAYDLLRPRENRSFTMKSRPVSRQIDQRQWLLFRNQSLQTYLEESVTPSYDITAFPGWPAVDASPFRETIRTFYHEILLPEDFRWEKIEVKTAGGDRWDKTRVEQNDRHLVLFFKEPVIGKYTVSLFGTISCKSDREIPFPLFAHDDRATVRRSVFCSRDSSVLVQLSLEEQSVSTIEDTPCPMPAFPSGHVLSAFRIESPEPLLAATLRVSSNKPEITGVMVSRLERDYPFTRWNMIVTCDVTIARGELDMISLFIPVHLSDELLTAFHWDSRLSDIPILQIEKNDGTQIQIKPKAPLSGKQSFEIQFPIGGTLDAVSVPNVRILHDFEIEHYVALPENSGEKPLAWALTNLSPTDVVPPVLPLQQRGPDTTASLIDMALTYRYYRAGQRDFSAKIRLLNEAAFVSCHDAAFFVKRNGLCFVVSVFDIQGNDSPYCDIAFPAEHRLIEMRLDDVFPLPERLDDATIRVELLPDIPVQRLTLVSCSPWDAAATRPATEEHSSGEGQSWPLSLVFPQILSFPVEKTLWEVWYEPLPAVDAQIHALVNVRNGYERFFSEHEMNALTLTDAGNLRVRIELARLSQVLTLARLMSATPQDPEEYPDRQVTWSRCWNGTRKRTARLLSEWNANRDSWDKTFLHGKWIVPQHFDPFTPEWEAWEAGRDIAWMDAWISRDKTPQAVYDELADQYQTLTGRTSAPLSPGGQDVADAQEIRERYLSMARFGNESTGIRYLAGAASCGISDLTLVFHSRNDPVSFGVYLHYALWGTVGLLLIVVTVHGNARRFFQRFSVLSAIILIVFCRLFVPPNVIGWVVLLVLLASAVCLQWDQMRTATTAATRRQNEGRANK